MGKKRQIGGIFTKRLYAMRNVIFWPLQSIFDTDADALCNPVNLMGVMGAGLAKKFQQRYPKSFTSYSFALKCRFLHQDSIWPYQDEKSKKIILHCPTKQRWNEKSDFDMVANTILNIQTICLLMKIPSVAVPKLGCGLGGLHWKVVREEMLFIARTNPELIWHIYGEK